MSKRGLVAYSDALRLEHGDEITVTTVYPGYIRTGIHDAARPSGVGLEGAVPAERVEQAAKTLARAALGRPVRDLATTRAGTIQYFLARRSPRRLLDALTNRAVRRMVPPRQLLGAAASRASCPRACRLAEAGRRLARMARDGWSALFSTRSSSPRTRWRSSTRSGGTSTSTPPTCACWARPRRR